MRFSSVRFSMSMGFALYLSPSKRGLGYFYSDCGFDESRGNEGEEGERPHLYQLEKSAKIEVSFSDSQQTA